MVFVARGRITARIMIHPHSLKSQSHLASRLVSLNQGMESLLARVHPSPRAVVLAATVNSIAVKRHVKPISVPVVSVVI